MLTCEEIHDINPSERLYSDWQELMNRTSPELRVFGPEWHTIWNRTIGSTGRWTGRHSAITVRDQQGTLQGVLHMARPRVGPLHVRSFGGYYQPWRSITCAAGREAEVGRAVGEYIAQSGWGLLQAGPAKASDACVQSMLAELSQQGSAMQLRKSLPLAIADVPSTWEEYRTQVLGSKFFRKVGYYERRTEKEGNVQIVHHRQPTGDALEQMIDDLGEIEKRSWLATAENGHMRFVDESSRRFWLEVIEEALTPHDQIDCWVMSLDNVPISFCLTVTSLPVCYVIANSYDEAVKQHRTGSTLYRYMIEDAINRGVRRFDYGTGELHYKKYWGAEYQDAVENYVVVPNRIVGGLFKLYGKLRPQDIAEPTAETADVPLNAGAVAEEQPVAEPEHERELVSVS